MKLPIVAALAALAVAGVAHATPTPPTASKVYDINNLMPLNLKTTYSSTTVKLNPGTTTTEFIFKVGQSVKDGIAGTDAIASGYDITSETLSLFTSAGKYVASETFTPTSTTAPTLTADLSAGIYDLYATVSVAAGSKGSYTVTNDLHAFTPSSAAPEPAAWLMMFAGLGLVGGVMRFARRNKGAVAAA